MTFDTPYVYIESSYDRYLVPMPTMRFYDSRVRIPNGMGEEYRIPFKNIKKIKVIEEAEELEKLLNEIVFK